MNTPIIFVLTLILYSISIECKLKSVHIVMRHGVRAPTTTYPLDPYINDTSRWPNGLSQLTEVGIEQAISIGKYLRKRYKKFYPENPKNSILRSTNVDRCLDTIALVSGQLWKSTGRPNSIQPRVFKSPMPFDGTLFHGPYCPNGVNESKNNLDTAEVKAFNKEHQSLYNYVSNKTGVQATMLGTLMAFDVIKAQKANQYVLPDWVNDYYLDKMGFIFYKTLHFMFSSELALKLKSGLLLKELKTRMDQVLKSSLKSDRWYKNFFIYSTHDIEVFGLNKALGIEQTTYPPFLAMTIFELHQINNKQIVKVFYINETESQPIGGPQVKLSFCPDYDCPYDRFTSSISSLFPNWKTDCGIPEDFDPFPVLEKYLTITNERDVSYYGSNVNYDIRQIGLLF